MFHRRCVHFTESIAEHLTDLDEDLRGLPARSGGVELYESDASEDNFRTTGSAAESRFRSSARTTLQIRPFPVLRSSFEELDAERRSSPRPRSCIIAVLETITCKTELGGPGVAYLDFPAAVCRFDLDSR